MQIKIWKNFEIPGHEMKNTEKCFAVYDLASWWMIESILKWWRIESEQLVSVSSNTSSWRSRVPGYLNDVFGSGLIQKSKGECE